MIRKPDLLSFVEAALAHNASLDGDLRFLRAGGAVAQRPRHGAARRERRKIGALIVLHDVTRLRRLENVRRDFVANVSHELRTPITSIKGFVETLLDEALENKENALRFLQIVHRQVNRLDAIICDLLTLSRIERGSEEQTIEAGRSRAGSAAGGGGNVSAAGRREGDRLVLQCPEDLTAAINAPLLEQAVVNLWTTRSSTASAGASVAWKAAAKTSGRVIRVKDEGCGIAAKHLPRLFERFYRVDKARSREQGGRGWGWRSSSTSSSRIKARWRWRARWGREACFASVFPPPVRASPCRRRCERAIAKPQAPCTPPSLPFMTIVTPPHVACSLPRTNTMLTQP